MKSTLQTLLDNIRLLKDKKINFIPYESRISLDNILFNIQYVSGDLISLKKAGRGKHQEFTIDFKNRTIKTDRKGFGVSGWSLNNEIKEGDILMCDIDKTPVLIRVTNRSADHQKITFVDLNNKIGQLVLSYQQFNESAKLNSTKILEALRNEYAVYARAEYKESNTVLKDIYREKKRFFSYHIGIAKEQFNIR